MFCRSGSILALVTAFLIMAATALAGVTPSRLNYQGLLTDPSGQPMNAAAVQMTFRIWDHPFLNDPSHLKWEETILVNVTDGLFNVILGDNVPIEAEVFDSSASYLGIQIGADAEGEPRTRLVSVGYSTRVETLDGARGGVISGTIGLEPDPNTKEGEDELLRFEIFDEQDSIRFWASPAEVFTPCLQFAGDDSRQCTAAINSGAAQIEEDETVTAIGSASVVLAQQTIDCPSDGYVLVIGSCQASLDLTESEVATMAPGTIPTYTAEFGITSSETQQPTDQRRAWSITGVEPFRKASNVVSLQKVFSVGAGESTFYLMAERTSGDADFEASGKTLSLVFIPRAYGEIGASARIGNIGGTTNSPAVSMSNYTSVNGLSVGSDNSASEIQKLRAEVSELKTMLLQVTAAGKKQ
ncbi:MAG: hypothetical protein WBP29_15240 [Candidatus Zixiibacteriota bacterium]